MPASLERRVEVLEIAAGDGGMTLAEADAQLDAFSARHGYRDTNDLLDRFGGREKAIRVLRESCAEDSRNAARQSSKTKE